MGFPEHAVIITAAGSSDRFNKQGLGVKKEYLSIDDHTVLYHSVEPFLQVPNLRAIIVTHPKDMADQCAIALEEIFDQNIIPVILVEGGEDRQESVYNALKLLGSMSLPIDYVAIHDGARCFVTPEQIIRTLATATVFGGAVPALIPTDALKSIDKNGVITSHLERTETVAVQTPQIFHFPEILTAHQSADSKENRYVDDTQVFTDFGMSVGICEGERENRKITYLEDIPNAEEQIDEYLKNLEEGKRKAKAAIALKLAMSQIQGEQAKQGQAGT
ncbi:MAG TPA: 2-C-methyl-D-erythritol 4-phosphate cytidylyltransferase [Sphaerochaeta sp.]|nr:2-C-methyl-D-erythritol 4-phosphate cytidylyltransferase [Sphaerochaeta sp.]